MYPVRWAETIRKLEYNAAGMNLDETLSRHEKGVSAWLDAAKKQVAALAKLQKAAQDGNLRDLGKLHAAARTAADSAQAAAEGCAPLEFDAPAYLAPGGGFVPELIDAAERAGVSLFERDGVVFSYPVLLRPEPDLAAVRVDKALVFSLQPAVLAAILKKLQAREPKAKPERFLETLFSAYQLVRGERPYLDLPLTDIYAALTLMPGSEKEYTLLDFARDLYFLDTSGITQTRKGYTLSLPASTSTRGSKVKPIPFVDRQGREKLYATLKFTPPEGG